LTLPISHLFFFLTVCCQDRFLKDKDTLEIEHHWFNYKDDFRTCNFDDAEEEIKDAWYFFCDHVMVEVSKNWKNSLIRSNTVMSEICTVSDEAFASTVLDTDLLHWIKKRTPSKGVANNRTDVTNARNEEDVTLTAEEAAAGKIKSKKYYSMYETLQKLKQDNPSDWNSWDLGYQRKISVSISSPKRRSASRLQKNVTSPSEASTGSAGKISLENW
jgi:hypothetical protein